MPGPRAFRATTTAVGTVLVVGVLVFAVLGGWRGPTTVTAAGSPTDAFDGPTGASERRGLGATDDGRVWRALRGRWDVHLGRARPHGRPPGGRALAVLDRPAADGAVGVTVAMPALGAGLAVRVVDVDNYWAIVASPAYSTWVIQSVVDGQVAFERNVGLQAVGGGTRVEVRLHDSWLDFYLDGVQVESVYDQTHREGTDAGLVAAGPPAASARFDDFVARSDVG